MIYGYVTLEEADVYISEHYISTDELRKGWEALQPDDKAALLRKSFQIIELLPFTGCKTCSDQPNAFPRWPSKEVPEAIKAAQVENALTLSDSNTSEDAAFYEKLWQFGVESYSIGNLSERTSQGAWGRSSGAGHGVVSAASSRLLQPYLSGSYCIGRP